MHIRGPIGACHSFDRPPRSVSCPDTAILLSWCASFTRNPRPTAEVFVVCTLADIARETKCGQITSLPSKTPDIQYDTHSIQHTAHHSQTSSTSFDTMAQGGKVADTMQEIDREVQAALLRRLDSLERLVFGKADPSNRKAQGFRSVPAQLESISKVVVRAEGNNDDLKNLATQASHLGLLSHASSVSAPSAEHDAIAEKIVLSAKGEIEATAEALAQVKALKEHVNPPYLRDVAEWSARLSKLDAIDVAQATEAARINDRADSARLHYSQAVTLISQKFVHRDDQVGELERLHRAQS